MFEKKVWNDRQSEHPARRRLTPTENDNEYEVSRAEGLVMEEGDAFDATTMNDLENRVAKAFAEYDPAELGAVNVTVQLYTCKKEGKVYQLTGSGAVGRCKIPAAWASGDTWKVNGTAVPAYCGADAVDGDCVVAGRWVLFTFDGAQLNFNGGGGLSNGKLARATASEAQVLAGAPFYAGNKALKNRHDAQPWQLARCRQADHREWQAQDVQAGRLHRGRSRRGGNQPRQRTGRASVERRERIQPKRSGIRR